MTSGMDQYSSIRYNTQTKSPYRAFYGAIVLLLLYPYTRSIFSAATFGIIPEITTTISSLMLILLSFARGNITINLKEKFLFVLTIPLVFLRPLFTPSSLGYYQVLYFVLFLVILIVENFEGSWIIWLLKTLLWVGIFYAATVILQYFFTDKFTSLTLQLFLSENQPSILSQLKNQHYMGLTHQVAIVSCYLVAGIAAGIALVRLRDSKKMLTCCLIVLLFVALFLTGKRAHILASAVSLFIVFYACSKTKSTSRATLLIFAIIAIIFLLLIFPNLTISGTSSISTTLKRLQNTLAMEDTEDILNGRSKFWEQSIALFKKSPFFGVGWGRYRELTGMKFNGHNVYLQLLAETGIVGFILFVTLMLSMFIKTYLMTTHIQRHPVTDEKKRFQYSIIFSLYWQGFFIIYCISGNPLYDLEYVATLFVSYAVYYSVKHYVNITENSRKAHYC